MHLRDWKTVAAAALLAWAGAQAQPVYKWVDANGKTHYGSQPPANKDDVEPMKLPGANGVGLIAVKGDLGEAKVSANDLLQAALRLRPDRIVLGELRGAETISFLRAINTGHPGSFSTVHANSPRGALEQIALMAMQTGIGLSRAETMEYAASVIDIVVQLDRIDGKRGIAAIAESGTLIA